MDKKRISESTAREIAVQKISQEVRRRIEVVKNPPSAGVSVCFNGSQKLEDYYVFSIQPERPAEGGRRLIFVARKGGEIAADTYIDE